MNIKEEIKRKDNVITICRKLFDVPFPPKNEEDERKMDDILDDLNDALCDLDGEFDLP